MFLSPVREWSLFCVPSQFWRRWWLSIGQLCLDSFRELLHLYKMPLVTQAIVNQYMYVCMYVPCVYKYRCMCVCTCVYELLYLCIISTIWLSTLHLYIYLAHLLIHLSTYILLISGCWATLFFCF